MKVFVNYYWQWLIANNSANNDWLTMADFTSDATSCCHVFTGQTSDSDFETDALILTIINKFLFKYTSWISV